MSLFEAVIYGVIQGLSEFLPVSSSGHLALLPFVLKIQDPGVVFDLCMHIGTALAVMLYFKNDLYVFFRKIPKLIIYPARDKEVHFFQNLIVTTIFSISFILLLMPIATYFRDPRVIIFNLSFFGLILAYGDFYQRQSDHLPGEPLREKLRWRDTFILGLSQALAIFPGVSRSGITLSSAFFLGYKRDQAAKFSFMMSLPIILAGVAKEVPEILKGEAHFDLMPMFVGILTSFVVGVLTIHFFMKLIQKIQLMYFAIYRIVLAILMIYFIYL